jgi:GNAT superfamily N-acetyltransferase
VTTQIEVRPAQAGDKDAVLAFCQNTFSWGDYVAEVWDTWLTDVRGQLLVGLVGPRPVGLVHLAFLESNAAWLEGMRVHPAFRRRGVGSAVDSAARRHARARGARLARLATSAKNIAAQETLATLGYACVARFVEWKAEPARSEFSATRVATHADEADILELWDGSLARGASGLVPDQNWHWDALTRARLHGQIETAQVRINGGGFAFLVAQEQTATSEMTLHALAGDAESTYTLALAARGEADYRGYPSVEALLIDQPQINSALERAGFLRQGGMLIYEQVL